MVDMNTLCIDTDFYESIKHYPIDRVVWELMSKEAETRGETVLGCYNLFTRKGIEIIAYDLNSEWLFDHAKWLNDSLKRYPNCKWFFYSGYTDEPYAIESVEDFKMFTGETDAHSINRAIQEKNRRFLKEKLRRKIEAMNAKKRRSASKVLKPVTATAVA